jgi:hypothetical protein
MRAAVPGAVYLPAMAPAYPRAVSLLLLAGLTGALSGCLAATAAAGAGAGIYLTTRGAESIVAAPVDEVEKRARAVLEAEGIAVTGFEVERSGARRQLRGTKGELEISVSMEQQGTETTKTEVAARKNLAVWDKEYAEQLLGKIVKRG